MAKIILISTVAEYNKTVAEFGGYPDKTLSPFSHGPIRAHCMYCHSEPHIPASDVILNHGSVCPVCENWIQVDAIIPDGGLTQSKLFWVGRYYYN